MRVTGARIRGGTWEAVLEAGSAAPRPVLEAVHLERRLDGLDLRELPDRPGHWALSLPIPADILSDGVQTVLLRDPQTGGTLAHFTLVAGAVLEDDIRAEVDLLRAELDMLKRAFRRHCVETAG